MTPLEQVADSRKQWVEQIKNEQWKVTIETGANELLILVRNIMTILGQTANRIFEIWIDREEHDDQIEIMRKFLSNMWDLTLAATWAYETIQQNASPDILTGSILRTLETSQWILEESVLPKTTRWHGEAKNLPELISWIQKSLLVA